MARWQVGLEGEPVDLDGLAAAFSDRPLRVMEDDGTFWLEAEELEHLSDHAQVKSAAASPWMNPCTAPMCVDPPPSCTLVAG